MQTFALKSFSRLSRPFTDDDDDDHVDDVGVRAHMGVCVVEAANLLVAVSEGEREREGGFHCRAAVPHIGREREINVERSHRMESRKRPC